MTLIRNDKLLEYIKTYDIEGYGIALHGIRLDSHKNPFEIYKEMFERGIIIPNNYGSINGTTRGIGRTPNDDEAISRELSDYKWGNSSGQYNVIVAYPPVIENSSGEKLYLGYTQAPSQGFDQNTVCSFMDIACAKLKYIPREFILGYYEDKDHRFGTLNRGEHLEYEFTSNEYFKKIDDALFEKMKEAMGIYAKLSSAYAKKDIETINNYNIIFEKYGMKNEINRLINNSNQDVFSKIGKRLN